MAYFTTDQNQGSTIVRFVFSEIGFKEREELKNELSSLLKEGDNKYIFNLSHVGFLSSLVIATMVFFSKEARGRGGEVKLCELTPEAQQVCQITRLDAVFDIYDTETEAISSFAS